jgi:hypothetical protein
LRKEVNYTISNIGHFKIIVQSTFSKWEELSKASVKANPHNPKGYVIVMPLKLERFRQGLVCIVFCGVYLEALFVIIGRKKFGVKYDKYYDKLIYEAKLTLFGCSDTKIISKCEQFRKARNDIIHEKALDINDIAECKDIDKEVNNAFVLGNLINSYFEVTKN